MAQESAIPCPLNGQVLWILTKTLTFPFQIYVTQAGHTCSNKL